MKKTTTVAVCDISLTKVKAYLEDSPITYNRLIDAFTKRCANDKYLTTFIKENIKWK